MIAIGWYHNMLDKKWPQTTGGVEQRSITSHTELNWFESGKFDHDCRSLIFFCWSQKFNRRSNKKECAFIHTSTLGCKMAEKMKWPSMYWNSK